jgi:hypothetical protein
MARRHATWRNAVWAIIHNNIAKPLSRLGDLAWSLGLLMLNTLGEFDERTKEFKQYAESKAWPED